MLGLVTKARLDRELVALQRLVEIAEHRTADAQAEAQHATRLHELERRRYDDLFAKYDALRLAGAVPRSDTVSIASKPPDPVVQAILRKAGSSAHLRKHYFDYVNEQRAQNTDEATIAAAILAGESLNPAVDGVLG